MTYTLSIEDRFLSGKTFECSNITRKVVYSTNRTGSPGKLTFDLLKSGDLSFLEGDPVLFKIDGTPIFYGYVFTKEQNQWGELSVTAYDQVRYLKANQSFVFQGMTAGDIIRQIAGQFELRVGEIEDTGYKIPLLICENKTCLDSIERAVQMTTVNTGKVFVFFDDCGALSLREAANLKQEIIVGERSLVTDYTYRSDIDQDTYNRIKLVQPNQDTGKGDVYIVEDSQNIDKWGLLQYYETVDENLNPAQIKAQAKTMLTYYNRALKTLTLSAIGSPGLRAGQMLYINIPKLGDLSLSKYVLLERVEHTIEGDKHTMEIETRALNGTD